MRKLLTLPIDWSLLIIPILLTVTGIVTIYTITFSSHQNSLAISQLIFAVIGLVIMVALMFLDYKFLSKHALIFYLLGIVLLLPLIPIFAHRLPFVLKVYGASRWINLGFTQLQPSEVFKVIAAIVGARLMARKVGELRWNRLLIYSIVMAIPIALVIMQPDLGTATIILAIFMTIFFYARPSKKIILVIILIAAILVPVGWLSLKDYQKNRIETFLNPTADPQGQGYNVRQSLIAVGSGGMTGRGFGQGSQTVLNFLPVPHADFIFAGFAEATGLVGASVMLVLYILLILRIIDIAREAKDNFGRLFALAMAIMFCIQASVHIGMNIGLLPVTGVPLPFMSYGGTALVIDFAVIGILQSIYIRNKRTVFTKD